MYLHMCPPSNIWTLCICPPAVKKNGSEAHGTGVKPKPSFDKA